MNYGRFTEVKFLPDGVAYINVYASSHMNAFVLIDPVIKIFELDASEPYVQPPNHIRGAPRE
jgi:hypothetical protein